MRVLMWFGENYDVIPGGHRVQMDKTAEALERLGIDVRKSTDPAEPLDDVDLVHAMSLDRRSMRRAREARLPVAVSTIYWSVAYTTGPRPWAGSKDRLLRHARLTVAGLRRGHEGVGRDLLAPIQEQQMTYECADLLLPNSNLEEATLRAELRVSTPAAVVPNGVDPALFRLPERERAREGVSYVARIEPHKNQLGLIRALRGTGIPLTLVGPVHPHHQSYFDACRRASSPDVVFLPGRPQHELVQLLQETAVHAMPSWYETTGLTTLEAALCGAAVVSTSRGFVREYFEDDIQYCRPEDSADIRRAVERALANGPSERLRKRILDEYTWERTAAATAQAYERLLAPPGTSAL